MTVHLNFKQRKQCADHIAANPEEFTEIGAAAVAEKLGALLGVSISTAPVREICESVDVNYRKRKPTRGTLGRTAAQLNLENTVAHLSFLVGELRGEVDLIKAQFAKHGVSLRPQ